MKVNFALHTAKENFSSKKNEKNALLRKILNGMILSTFGISFSINVSAQESLPSWECTQVSPGA